MLYPTIVGVVVTGLIMAAALILCLMSLFMYWRLIRMAINRIGDSYAIKMQCHSKLSVREHIIQQQ